MNSRIMRTTFAVLALALAAAMTARAEINVGAGVGLEAGSVTGSVTTNGGNTPIALLMPEVFVEAIYRHGPEEGGFGIDLVISAAASEAQSYVQAYQPFQYFYSNFTNPNGDPGISLFDPEIITNIDFSYHFPRLGPVDFAVLVGGIGWEDVNNSSKVEGVAVQTGAAVTLHYGTAFIQGRGSYRVAWRQSIAGGLAGYPAPLGTAGFMLLAGFSVR